LRFVACGSILQPMRNSTGLVTAALALFASTAGARVQDRSEGTKVGDFLPDLELPTIDGTRTIRLSELRGQRLLLIQFASW